MRRTISTVIAVAWLAAGCGEDAQDQGDAAAAPIPGAVATGAAGAAGGGALRVTEVVLARGVEGGGPLDARARFALRELERVYCFVTADNPTGRPAQVGIHFAREGGATERSGSGTSVPAGPAHRVWAWTSRRAPGRWSCTVRSSAGAVLGRAEYEITP